MGKVHEETVEPGDLGTLPVCKYCGSERVAKDAWACWNPKAGLWELETVFDDEHCHQCDGETRLIWKRVETVPRQKVRELNDRFRCQGLGNGSLVISVGVRAQGAAFIQEVVDAVRAHAAFTEENDPWGEHDFGSLKVGGQTLFWKIEYYSPDLRSGSENPAHEGLTHRVLTIMLASEY